MIPCVHQRSPSQRSGGDWPSINNMLKREKFAGGEPGKKSIWYLELPLIFCVMLGFVGAALALIGSLTGFMFLIISVISGALLFALLNRRKPF